MKPDPTEAERWGRFGNALATALPKSRFRTQKALAAHLGVDQTLVSAWTRGKKLSRMTPAKVSQLERALGPEVCPPGSLAAILYGAVADAALVAEGDPQAIFNELRRLVTRLEEAGLLPPEPPPPSEEGPGAVRRTPPRAVSASKRRRGTQST